MPTVTITMASAFWRGSPTGRMITRSMTAPPTNESSIEMTMATQIDHPLS